jgi:hypothetical protein
MVALGRRNPGVSPLCKGARKTEKGLPRYDDSDVFVLSGAEDLVPCRKKAVDPTSGQEMWVPEDPIQQPHYTV